MGKIASSAVSESTAHTILRYSTRAGLRGQQQHVAGESQEGCPDLVNTVQYDLGEERAAMAMFNVCRTKCRHYIFARRDSIERFVFGIFVSERLFLSYLAHGRDRVRSLLSDVHPMSSVLAWLHVAVTSHPLSAVGWVFFETYLFVWSLHIWNALRDPSERSSFEELQNTLSILQRCVSASIVSLLLVLVSPSSWAELGFPSASLAHVRGALFGGLVTALLFIGPITWLAVASNESWKQPTFDLQALRCYAFAPLFEEIVFRSCMLPVLVKAGLSVPAAIGCASVAFGMAHHIKFFDAKKEPTSSTKSEHFVDAGRPSAHIQSILQATYTTIFGAMACCLLVRTGTFVAPLVSHSLCNYMGLPTLEFTEYPGFKWIWILYMFGPVSVFFLLSPSVSASWFPPSFPYR